MIKQLLKNNRIVQRIKVLKDLFLQKLDDLQASVDQIKITTDQNLEEIRLELEQKIEILIRFWKIKYF